VIRQRTLGGSTLREVPAGQIVVLTFAAILMAAGLMELLVVVGAAATGWVATNLEALPRLLAILIGLWSAIATFNMGKRLMPTGVPLDSRLGAPTEACAGMGLAMAIGAVVLIWPFGILLGPAALLVSLRALSPIKRAGGDLSGFGIAASAAVPACFVCGLYLFVLVLESAAALAFGELIPAAP